MQPKLPAVLSGVVFLLLVISYRGARSDDPESSETVANNANKSMRGRMAGDVRNDNGLEMKLLWCLPGLFTMEQLEVTSVPAPEKGGRPRLSRKITPIQVTLTQGYWLGKYEVTQSEWKEVMGTEPWNVLLNRKSGDEYPATCVDWKDAMDFCRELTDRERRSGRLPEGWEYTLPTEAQWERACRARTETRFSFGDDESKLGEFAWCYDNTMAVQDYYDHPVGTKKPNPWGFHDMHGNVYEWCRDWYAIQFSGGRDPERVHEAAYHVVRGGSWQSTGDSCRSASRGKGVFSERSQVATGFRLALCPTTVKPK